MTQALVKFYNIDDLLFESIEKMKQLIREDYHPYSIKCEIHRMSILENQNMTLCSLLYDTSYYEYSDKDKLILSIYKNNETNKTDEKILIMELKIENISNLNQIKESYHQKRRFHKYKGPLSYEPVRVERTSLLSSESPEQNYRGFINLAILILLLNHIRLIVENFMKYGILLKNIPFVDSIKRYKEYPLVYCCFHYLINSVLALYIQRLQFTKKISTKLIFYMNFLNIGSLFIFPVIWVQHSHPAVNMILLMVDLILMMKLTSYAHVMRNMRHFLNRALQVQVKKDTLETYFTADEISSQNLEIIKKCTKNPLYILKPKHFAYFLFAPTLCFQFSYPRSPSIRWIWLSKRIIEYIAISVFQIIIFYQYVEPILLNTYRQYEEDGHKIDILKSTERLLKLALPNTYLWVAFFFATFQCWANILAELLRFGDRQFYLDWWNCKNLEEYWKLWNLPVHQWLIRHVYFPLLKRGYSKVIANLIVFLVSALGHEYIVSASIGELEYWAFIGMMSQAPVILIQKKIEKIFKLQNSQLGNVMFWISFCFLGQPLMIFVYYYSFLKKFNQQL